MDIHKKDIKFIDLAFDVASKSTMKMQHGSVVVKGNKMIASGYNSERTSFSDGFTGKTCSCHAEMAALRNALKPKRTKNPSKVYSSFSFPKKELKSCVQLFQV